MYTFLILSFLDSTHSSYYVHLHSMYFLFLLYHGLTVSFIHPKKKHLASYGKIDLVVVVQNHHHHHQSRPNYVGLTAWIIFLHSNLSWAKFCDRLLFIRSIFTTSINVLFGLPLFLDGALTCIEKLFLTGAMLVYVGHVHTILNDSLLICHHWCYP